MSINGAIRCKDFDAMEPCRGGLTNWICSIQHFDANLAKNLVKWTNLSVSYTEPQILMESIRSPDKVLILLMDS